MFKPTHNRVWSFTLSNKGLIHALSKRGKVIKAWHPHETVLTTGEGPAKSTTVAQLGLELITKIAKAVAWQLLGEFMQSSMGSTEAKQREEALSLARAAYGGRRALHWTSDPSQGTLPITGSNVRILREACERLNAQKPARQLTSSDQDLLAALFFGEFVFSTHLIW